MTATSVGDALHERETELAQLGQALERTLAGQGGVVLVEGSPGIGKTRLLDEVARMAGGRARVLRARGGEQERDIPLLVTRELFTPYVTDAPAEELDRVFAGAAALAGPLLGRGVADGGTTDGFALVHGLYWLVANLSDDRPLVLLVDDVHWVDDATQRWLAYLLPRVAELPVLLAMAARPRELDPASPLGVGLAAVRDLATLSPGQLSPAAAASVIQALLPAAADDFCTAVHHATGGNPLLIRALTAAVQDQGLEPSADTARRVEQVGALGLSRVLLPRLHGLGSPAVALARAVAILGDGCALVDAAELVGLGRHDAGAAYDALVAADILRGDVVGFTHPLVRAVVTDDVPPGTTSGLHLRAARVLLAHKADPEDVARHVAVTDPVREPWAVAVLQDAAAVAATRGAPESAVRHLATLLREDLDAQTRCLVLIEAGRQAFRCEDPRGLAWLEEAAAQAPDQVTAAIAWAALVNWRAILLEGGDPGAGMPREPEGEAAMVVAATLLLDMGFSAGRFRSVQDWRLDVDPPAGETMIERMYLCSLAMDEVLRCGRAADAVDFVERAWRGTQLLDEAIDSASPAWAIISNMAAGDYRQARQRAHAAMELAVSRGSARPVEWCVMGTGMIELLAGDVASAEATLETWVEEFGVQVPITMPSWAATVAEVLRQRDRIDAAYAAIDSFGEWRDDWHGANAHHSRGMLHLTSGRFSDALADFRRSGQILDSFAARRSAMPAWRLGASASLAALGRVEEARELAEDQLADARHWGAAPLLGASLRNLATVLGADEGIAVAEEAVGVLGSSEAAGEHTEALLVLGRLLRVSRETARAREVLTQALDQAERQGALLLARLAEEELRMLGARPRRRSMTGVHALTPAELRVATLAAGGLSNPEIAQTLFVTRKTVEKHLGSAFSKLHVSSRDQLPTVLERRPTVQ